MERFGIAKRWGSAIGATILLLGAMSVAYGQQLCPGWVNHPDPQGYAYFGYVAAGDVNGDGKSDIIIGAHMQDVGGNINQGQAFVFSGATGALLYTLNDPTPQANAYFGQS